VSRCDIALVGNKIDLVKGGSPRCVTLDEAEAHSQQLGAQLYIETSAVTGQNVDELWQFFADKNGESGAEQSPEVSLGAEQSPEVSVGTEQPPQVFVGAEQPPEVFVGGDKSAGAEQGEAPQSPAGAGGGWGCPC
jgi:hypothetical protein